VTTNTIMGEVIAEREYEGRDASGGEPHRVLLRIGKPRPAPRLGGDWVCPVQVLGIGDDEVREAGGIDAVQALQLGMAMAGVILTYPPRGVTVTLWGESDLGLPLPDSNAAAFDFSDDADPED